MSSSVVSKNKSLWIARETIFDTDPSGTGAAYLPVPAEDLGEVIDMKEILPTAYATGRPFPTAHEVSESDMWSLSFKTPLVGLESAAGYPTDPASITEDWLDVLLRSVFGAPSNVVGVQFAAGNAGTTMALDAEGANVGDIVAANAAAHGGIQWRYVTGDDTSNPYTAYTIQPAWETAPASTDESVGVRSFRASHNLGGGYGLDTGYIRAHWQSGSVEYNLAGGYVTSLKLNAEVNGRVMLEWTIQGKTKTASARASKPSAIAAPVRTPIKLHRSALHHGATAIGTQSLSIDFGLSVAPILAGNQSGAIVGWQSLGMSPTVSVNPIFANSWTDLKRAGTKARLLIQLGFGTFTTSYNTVCIAFSQAQVAASDPSDAGGLRRNAIELMCSDPVQEGTVLVDANLCSFNRA